MCVALFPGRGLAATASAAATTTAAAARVVIVELHGIHLLSINRHLSMGGAKKIGAQDKTFKTFSVSCSSGANLIISCPQQKAMRFWSNV